MPTATRVPRTKHVISGGQGKANTLSSKVTAATLAGAVATVVWTILGATALKSSFTAAELSALVAGSTTILAALFGFLQYESQTFVNYWHTTHSR